MILNTQGPSQYLTESCADFHRDPAETRMFDQRVRRRSGRACPDDEGRRPRVRVDGRREEVGDALSVELRGPRRLRVCPLGRKVERDRGGREGFGPTVRFGSFPENSCFPGKSITSS